MVGWSGRLRVFLLSNADLTSDLLYAPLFDLDTVEIVGVGYTRNVSQKRRSSRVLDALLLARRTAFSYWLFQAYINGLLGVRDLVGATAYPSVRRLCRTQGIPIYSRADFSTSNFVDTVCETRPDLMIVRVNQILSKELIALPRHGTWCLHSSLLPSHRGIAGELHALKDGDTVIGSTVFQVAARLDHGQPLYMTSREARSDKSVFWHIVENNCRAAALLADVMDHLAREGVAPPPQLYDDVPASSYHSWPKREDLRALKARGVKLMHWSEAWAYAAACLGLAESNAGVDAAREGPVK